MPAHVYILTNKPYGTLYVGVTSDLAQRVWIHRNDLNHGFSRRYGLHRLVYFEEHDDIREAIHREKQLKRCRRRWKTDLIETVNPTWRDLYEELNPAH